MHSSNNLFVVVCRKQLGFCRMKNIVLHTLTDYNSLVNINYKKLGGYL